MWRRCAVAVVALLLVGCVSNKLHQQWQPHLSKQPTIAELSEVPFFPQEAYQCGPAALAMLLSWLGRDISPETLSEQLFISGRKGSLQVELLAASRRHGVVPYVHDQGLQDLFAQLRQGVPVLVLQNLGLSWAPAWHYAVVVGYDAVGQVFLLRSGKQRLHQMDSREFARTWRYGGQWMLTLHQAGDIPAGATPLKYIESVSGLERVERYSEVVTSYQAATKQWPQSFIAWMALGNSLYQMHDFAEAERAYRKAYQIDGQHAAAAHNLAWALIQQEKQREALPYAQTAASLSELPRYQSALQALQ